MQQIFSGKPITIAELTQLALTAMALFQGHPVPPIMLPAQQEPPPPPPPPAPVAPPSGSTVATSLSVGAGGAAMSVMATLAGLLGPFTGPDASMWSAMLPIASVAAGALFPGIAPAISVISNLFSTYAAGKAAQKPKA